MTDGQNQSTAICEECGCAGGWHKSKCLIGLGRNKAAVCARLGLDPKMYIDGYFSDRTWAELPYA